MKKFTQIKKICSLGLAALFLSSALSACGNKNDDAVSIAFPFAPVASLSPFSDDANLLTRMGIAETLMYLDTDGQPQPWLAEKAEVVDNRTVSFVLRENVQFSDGEKLTAERAVESLRAAYDASPRPSGLGKNDLTFEAADERTVIVRSAVEDPILVARFTDPGTVIMHNNTGTGPYSVESVNTSTASLQAHEAYWGGKPSMASYTAEFITDGGTRVNALRSGDVDAVVAVPVSRIEQLSDFSIESVDTPRMTYAYLNTAQGVFADPVQRSLAFNAVDADLIAQTAYEGHAASTEGSLFNPHVSWNIARLTSGAITEVAPEGTPTSETITIGTITDRAELGEVASLLAQQLRDVGFTVDISVTDYKTQEQRFMGGDFDIVILSRNYQLGAGDPVSYLSSDFTCSGGFNMSHYCNPIIDGYISTALEEIDSDTRYRSASRIGADIIADHVLIPIALNQTFIGYSSEGIDNLYVDPYERRLVTQETK